MRTYTKPTFMDRVKLAAIWITLGSIVMWLMSCSDPEPIDHAKGTWTYEAFHVQSGTQTQTDFIIDITVSSHPYQVTVDRLIQLPENIDLAPTSIQVDANSINSINSITITGQDFEIVFNDLKPDEFNPIMWAENLNYSLPNGTNIQKGALLKRK